jgi:hypothetical protein
VAVQDVASARAGSSPWWRHYSSWCIRQDRGNGGDQGCGAVLSCPGGIGPRGGVPAEMFFGATAAPFRPCCGFRRWWRPWYRESS